MGFVLKHQHFFCVLFVVVFLPALCFSQDNSLYSRATYYGSPDCKGNPTGACGYGDYGRTVNNGDVAGVSWLWKYGAGCGGCYQVRCTKPECNAQGVTVVVTDHGVGDHTDFILSPSAYGKMAQPDKVHQLYAYGVVEIQYRRVPCDFNGNKLTFKIHDHSKYPHYLAVVVLHTPDESDCVGVDIWVEEYKEWKPMRRAFGAVFDVENPPLGTATLRFQLTSSAGTTYLVASNVDWKSLIGYESYAQLN